MPARFISFVPIERLHDISIYSLGGNEFFQVEHLNGNRNNNNLYLSYLEGGKLRKTFIARIDFSIQKAIRLGDDKYFISAFGNHQAFILDKGQLRPLSVKTLLIMDALTDRDGNLWLATEEGVFNCYRLQFEAFTLGFGRSDFMWDIQKDRYGNIWTSSFGSGIWRTTPDMNISKAQRYLGGKEVDENAVHMNGCEDAIHRLYFNSNKGLVVFDPRKGNNNKTEIVAVGTSLSSYYDAYSNTVFSGGMDSSFLLSAISPNLEFKTYPFKQGHIISICRDANRRLRMGTFQGEAYLDEKLGCVVEDTTKRDYKSLISMAIDKNGTLWKASLQGLFAEDSDGKNTKTSDERTHFVSNYKDRYILFGGEARILHILDLDVYTKDKRVSISSFSRYQGFDVLECGQNGSYIDSDGYVWIVGGDKLIKFHPDEITQRYAKSKQAPFISTIYSTRKDGDGGKQLHALAKSIIAEYDYNSIHVEWLLASMNYPEELTFRCRLVGYSEKWFPEQKDRLFSFNNLSPGTYYFEVQSTENGVDWSPVSKSVEIIIKPAFWLSYWFFALLILLFLALFAGILLWFRKRWENKQEEAHRIDQLKLRSIRSKHVPHFTGNVLSAINYLVLSEPEQVNEYINKFSDFSQQTLVHSEKASRCLSDEINYTDLYLNLEKLRFGDKFNYSISVDKYVATNMQVPALTLYTFCENAMKHGLRQKKNAGFIKVYISKSGDYTVLSVEDNGIGRQKAKELKTSGTGEGLSILEQQLKVYNKKNRLKAYLKITDLVDENHVSCGSCFELFIPNNYKF